MIVSTYATDEEIQVDICDQCYGVLGMPLTWVRFAPLGVPCCLCGTPNAVDVVRVDGYWRSGCSVPKGEEREP